MPTRPWHFLFLHGPHGPRFKRLARALQGRGADVSRIALNAGDALIWRGLPRYWAFPVRPDGSEAFVHETLDAEVTDLVCYGAARPFHATARRLTKARKITIDAFEEGYLRPYWMTSERDGMNADSGMNALTLVKMEEALAAGATIPARATDAWCDMRQHVLRGAVLHAALIAGWRSYPGYISHRTPEPNGEFSPLYLSRLLSMPLRRLKRRFATAHIRRTTFPFHVVLCSLADSANFRESSTLESQAVFWIWFLPVSRRARLPIIASS